MNQGQKHNESPCDDRLRIERSIAARLAEGSDDGNVAVIRLHKIRLAALRFAYEATTEQRRRLAAFDHGREQRSVDPVAVAKVIYDSDMPAEVLEELFGVADVTDDEADFFVANV
ncbi:MAG TPA: hypothetical protein VMH32_10310, partial [Burkholderiales bacterium]|nr:hypothetical protein [Burkholderiales bacterium]